MDDLGGGVLEEDGIQGLVPAEEKPGDDQHGGVAEQDIIPRVDAAFFRYRHRNEIGAAARGPAQQAQADGKAVDDPSEYADEQHVVGDG